MKILLNYIKKSGGIYLIGTMAMLAGVVLDMFNPRQVQRIIDDVIIGGNTDIFGRIILILTGITFGRAIFGYLKEYMFDTASSTVTAKLRLHLFDHIQGQSFSFFDRINTGELMSRMKEDTENVMNVICFGLMLFVEQTLYFFIATVLLFRLDWRLALVSLSVMPVIAFIALRLENKIGVTYEKISDQRALLNTTAQESLAGVRLVKSFGREKHEVEKFLEQNNENAKLNVEQAMVLASHQPIIEFLTGAASVLVITVGGYLVIRDEMTIGTLVAFNSYVFMLIWPMRMLGWLVNMLAQCRASLKKIDGIFEQKPEIVNPQEAFSPHKIKGHIVFKGVGLEIDGARILKDINFEAKPGTTIAVMGETGSGKSSLINLIGRYYDRTEGTILIDGVDVREYDLQALRRGISVVMQDVFLFSDTVKGNILFGFDVNEQASGDEYQLMQERMYRAANDAHIHDFISSMTHGYDTPIGERGIGLSEGQRQRITIARAIARDCGILILDDSTSSLDFETEYRIQESISKQQEVTKLIVAHRVIAARAADEILYFSEGKIAERGTHEELLKIKGRYYETWMIQQQGI